MRGATVGCLAGWLFAATADAGTYFVATNGAHISPFSSWANAATSIQAAVDIATAGSVIYVSNGVYNTGGRAVTAGMTNRVVIDKAVTVQSMNGPAVTTIAGQPCPTNGSFGNGAVRCVSLANSGVLAGFTLTNGYTLSHATATDITSGGGVQSPSFDGVVSNCVITGCFAYKSGGGAEGVVLHRTLLVGNESLGSGGGADESTLYNCVIRGNTAYSGGGAAYSTLHNCTVVENVGTNRGGGVSYSTCISSIMYYNTSPGGNNFYFWSYTNCCMYPSSSSGTGTVTNEPLFVDRAGGDFRLLSHSPCINAGRYAGWMSGAVDMDGNPRVVGLTVDIGAFEYQSLSDPLSVEIVAPYRRAVLGIPLPFEAVVTGNEQGFRWDFGDGHGAQNEPYTTNTYAAAGWYDVVLTASNLAGSASATVQVEIVSAGFAYYVATNGSDAAAGTNWATAKATIQAAVDSAGLGCIVWVTNGVYDQGGRTAGANASNRVAVDKRLSVFSMNGPDFTCIVGQRDPATGSNGPAAIRCVYLDAEAVLGGFTLSNGHTVASGDIYDDRSGGGAYCESTNAVITNCVIVDCTANYGGGGACLGTLHHCEVLRNAATSSGGGLYRSAIHRTMVSGNQATSGGGISSVRAYSSVIRNNVAATYGGGASADSSLLYNCTVTGNTAGDKGGGMFRALAWNSIVYHNTAGTGSDFYEGAFTNCCAYPLAPGADNITNAPGIVSTVDPRLLPSSICIDAGTNESWMSAATDIEGGARIVNGIVDMGAYEFVSSAGLTGPLSVAISATYTQAPSGFAVPFEAVIEGRAQGFDWSFGDGAVATNVCNVSHAYSGASVYDVTLVASNLSGAATATVSIAILVSDCHYYVATNGSDGAAGTNWATAKATIQAAVDAASMGCTIWVSNGVYATGGSSVHAGLTNRVTIDKVVTVLSMNGPGATVIRGQACPTNGASGNGAIRCVYLASGARLIGFTLTNGYTLASGGDAANGGGAWCAGEGAVLSNCVIAACGAGSSGGGLYGGAAHNGRLLGNSAHNGGAAYGSALVDCEVAKNHASGAHGGGAYGGTLTGCGVYTNDAQDRGGGIYEAIAHDSTIEGNTSGEGGGAYGGALNGCALRRNVAAGAMASGGGASQSDLDDCDVFFNAAVYGGGAYGGTLTNCDVQGNVADYGGGVYDGELRNCTVTANIASNGGGMFEGIAYDTIIAYNAASASHGNGGGASQATVHRSLIAANMAAGEGGGARLCTLYNCILMVNTSSYGGGTAYGEGESCTIIGNQATSFGGGTFWGTFHNSIVYYNFAFASLNNYFGWFTNCCVTPTPDGTNNITSSPQFVNYAVGDVHLLSNSPCINRGTNRTWMTGATDIEGNDRIIRSIVDMGAYEYVPPDLDSDGDGILDAHETDTGVYNGPTDTGTDPHNADTDGDHLPDGEEIAAGTNPVDDTSWLGMVAPEGGIWSGGVVVSWQSTSNIQYRLERATNLSAGFTLVVQSNITAIPFMNTVTDSTASGEGPYFYRVRTE